MGEIREGAAEAVESRAEKALRAIVDEAVYWRDTTNSRDRLATPEVCVGRALDNNGYKTRDQARNTMFGRVKAALARRAKGDSPLLRPKSAPTRPTRIEPSAATAPAPKLELAPPAPARGPSADEVAELAEADRRQRRAQMFREAYAHEKRQPRDAYSVEEEDDAA